MVASPVASVRLRTTAGNRAQRGESATALIWHVRQGAAQPVRRLTAPEVLPAVYAGIMDVDGVKQTNVTQEEVAA